MQWQPIRQFAGNVKCWTTIVGLTSLKKPGEMTDHTEDRSADELSMDGYDIVEDVVPV